MQQKNHLSLTNAVLININIMIGTGLFINTVPLAAIAGPYGSLSYGVVALLLLPLVLSISQLLSLFPAGGFYQFSATLLTPFWGFLSTWSYFFAKLGSASVGIHTFSSIIKEFFPTLLSSFSPFFLDGILIFIFTLLNKKNIKAGASIQNILVFSKIIPITLVVFLGSGLFHFSLPSVHCSFSAYASTLPLVLFSLLGFEAICSVSQQIESPQKNGSYAVLLSYAIVVCVYLLYQTLFYNVLSTAVMAEIGFKDIFPILFAKGGFEHTVAQSLSAFMYLLIGTSALSGAYGIFFTNQWNLYTLASHELFSGYQLFNRLNSNHVPFACICMEGVLCILYLYLTAGDLPLLQQLAALGTTVTYTFSIVAFLKTKYSYSSRILGSIALFSCLILISACIKNFIFRGASILLLYCCILIIGIVLFTRQRYNFEH